MSPYALVRLWRQFFFQPASPTPMALFRILVGLLVLADLLLTLLPDFALYFGDRPLIPIFDIVRNWWQRDPYFDLILLLPDAQAWRVGFFFLTVFAAVLMTVGLFTRLSALALFVCLLSIDSHFLLNQNAGDTYLRLCVMILSISNCGDAISFDNLVRAFNSDWRRDGFGARRSAPWAQRLMQIQMTYVYFQTWLVKISGPLWLKGLACYYVSRYDDLMRFPVPFIFENLLALKLLTWYTLVVEFALFTCIWFKRLRYWVLLNGVILHLGLDWSLNLPLFEWIFMASFVLFIDPEHLSAASLSIKRRIAGWFGRPSDLMYDANCIHCVRAAGLIHRLDLFSRVRCIDLHRGGFYSSDDQTGHIQSSDARSSGARSSDARSSDVQSSDVRSSDVRSSGVQFGDVQSSDVGSLNVPSGESSSVHARSDEMDSGDIHGGEFDDLDISPLGQHLVLKTHNGLLSGFAALRWLSARLPLLWLSCPCLYVPGSALIVKRLYGLIGGHGQRPLDAGRESLQMNRTNDERSSYVAAAKAAVFVAFFLAVILLVRPLQSRILMRGQLEDREPELDVQEGRLSEKLMDPAIDLQKDRSLLFQLGDLYWRRRQYSSAEACYKSVLDAIGTPSKSSSQADVDEWDRAALARAGLSIDQSLFEEANTRLTEILACDLNRWGSLNARTARDFNNLGLVAYLTGLSAEEQETRSNFFRQANAYLDKALDIYARKAGAAAQPRVIALSTKIIVLRDLAPHPLLEP